MLERLRCISSTEVCVGPSVTGIPPILLLATKIIPYRFCTLQLGRKATVKLSSLLFARPTDHTGVLQLNT
jgi:hypothetical protein